MVEGFVIKSLKHLFAKVRISANLWLPKITAHISEARYPPKSRVNPAPVRRIFLAGVNQPLDWVIYEL